MNTRNTLILLVSLSVLTAIFFFNKTPSGDATSYIPPKGSEKALASAVKLLSKETKRDSESISVVEVLPRMWIDACLGLGEKGEECAKKETEGFEVLLETKDVMYVVRTNVDGSTAKLIE